MLERMGLPGHDHPLDPAQASAWLEHYDLHQRQVKFIVNSVRAYEWFGYEWRLPFWDREVMEFWAGMPLELRMHRRLFCRYASDERSGLGYDRQEIIPSSESPLIRRIQRHDLSWYLFRLFTNLRGYAYDTNAFNSLVGKKRYFGSLFRINNNINSFLSEDILGKYRSKAGGRL